MSTSPSRVCRSVLRFTVLLSCWLRAHHNVFAANVTVRDTDPSILYSPLGSWFSSSNLCSTCINPNISMSFHEGINSALSPGSTASSTSSTIAPPLSTSPVQSSSNSVVISEASSSSTLSPSPAPISSPNLSSEGGSPSTVSSLPSSPPSPSAATSSPNLSSEGGPLPSSSPSPSPTKGEGGPNGRNGMDGRALARRQSNGSDPITLSFSFTGTAIYIFAILPPTEFSSAGTPTNTNLLFTLDNKFVGNFSSGTTANFTSTNVLSQHGLPNQLHQLVVTVGNDSIFIFDHLIYTNSSAIDSASSTPQPTHRSDKRNNIATFAGALGGSVGVLSLFSLGIAISIMRRRILAARRDRLDSEANPTSDTASMSGPRPFIPRFFPDTIIPPDPPNYNDALSSTNHNNTPLMASLVSSVYSSRQRSYADIPPSSPPPQLEELPPPPFPVAVSTPVLDLPADGTSPSISSTNQTDLAGDSPIVASPHEDTPLLLQSSDSDNTRPRSRTSTHSSDPSEDIEINSLHQEDAS